MFLRQQSDITKEQIRIERRKEANRDARQQINDLIACGLDKNKAVNFALDNRNVSITEKKQIRKAFKSADIRTEKAINNSSKKAKRDFETIKNSGVASANDIKRAHNAMTEKIKKNNLELNIGVSSLSKALVLGIAPEKLTKLMEIARAASKGMDPLEAFRKVGIHKKIF